MALEPLTPLYTADLFPGLSAELITLLRGLDAADWVRPTIAGSWRVRDVVAHLLDGDLRKLALCRDSHALAAGPISSFADIVTLINQLNAGGVRYGERLSPRLMTDLLEVTGRWVSEYIAALAPHAEACFAVAWADEERSENWMDTGREYTERWHHQMQIREAVGALDLFQRTWFFPILDFSVRAFRRAYKDVPGAPGTAVVFEVDGERDYVWSVIRDASAWRVMRGRASDAAASVRVDADTAWKLLYNAIPPDAARARVIITGDPSIAQPILGARSVMV
jgi:mycothiol maleylpyruvate isomerase-like protein